MDRDTNTKIVAFVILSVFVHALIIYVVAKTKFTEPDPLEEPEGIAFVTDQNKTINENSQPVKPQKIAQARPQKRSVQPPPKPRRKAPPVKQQPQTKPVVADMQPNQPESSVPLAMEEKAPADLPSQNEADQLPAKEALPLKEAVVADNVETPLQEAIANATEEQPPTDTPESPPDESSAENVAEVPQEDTAVQAESTKTEVTEEVKSEAQTVTAEASSDESSVATEEASATEEQVQAHKTEGVAQAGAKAGVEQGQAKGESLQASEDFGEGLSDVPVYQREQLKVLRPTSIVYPEVSRRRKEVGTAKLRVLFDAKGTPQKTMLVKSTGSKNLDHAALQGMQTLRFKGLGHPFIYETPVQFQLEFNDQQLNQLINFSNKSQMKAQAKDNDIVE